MNGCKIQKSEHRSCSADSQDIDGATDFRHIAPQTGQPGNSLIQAIVDHCLPN
jgi:hypothetical protein